MKQSGVLFGSGAEDNETEWSGLFGSGAARKITKRSEADCLEPKRSKAADNETERSGVYSSGAEQSKGL